MSIHLQSVLRDCRHLTLESLSDDQVPAAIEQLAAIASVDTGVKIHAIKLSNSITYRPERKPKNELDWCVRRLCGGLRPSDPKCVKLIRPCWSLIVDGTKDRGNPITLESWMLANGVEATAVAPTRCQIVLTAEQESICQPHRN